jgi:Zn-dependent peptidase ImmA (M78 family)
LPNIEVAVEPRHRIPRLAGFTHLADGGRWLITVNKDETQGERRQTLAHEFKHILDHPAWGVAYAHLGFGDEDRHDRAIEDVCDHFAACMLMPHQLVRKAWLGGLRDPEALAEFFGVSEEAVVARAEYLGLGSEERRPIKSYFRLPAPITTFSLPRLGAGFTSKATEGEEII